MHTGLGISSPFTSSVQPYGFSPFGVQGTWLSQQSSLPYGQQQITQWLQILPQQLQQVQQLSYVQQQLLQQLLQVVPAQLQQLQQAIHYIPQQVLQIVAQQQFGGGLNQLTQPQQFGVPFPQISPYGSPFAGSPGQVM